MTVERFQRMLCCASSQGVNRGQLLLFRATFKFIYRYLIKTFHFSIIADRLAGQPPTTNGSPRSSIRSNHSSKPATPPPNSTNRNGTIILDVSPKPKVKELENNNSSKIVNKNNSNASKMQQQQALQQLVDQQTLEKQKQMVELLHASKGAEALGVLVQYLVFNVSIVQSPFLHVKNVLRRNNGI